MSHVTRPAFAFVFAVALLGVSSCSSSGPSGGDTAASLSARILEQEHRILPEAIQLVLVGRCRLDGGRAVIS